MNIPLLSQRRSKRLQLQGGVCRGTSTAATTPSGGLAMSSAPWGTIGAVPVVDTQDTLQDSLGSAWGCLPGDGTNGTMIKNDQSIFK
jgi:hypothetical protein